MFEAFRIKGLYSAKDKKSTLVKSALDIVYIKDWLRTSEATVFKLSNKINQVNFSDNSRIIIDLDNVEVTYLNKSSKMTTLPILDAFNLSD